VIRIINSAALALLCVVGVIAAGDDPTIDKVFLDGGNPKALLVHFDRPFPALKDINQGSYWVVLGATDTMTAKYTVSSVDTSMLAGTGFISLLLDKAVPKATTTIEVTLINDVSIVHVSPDVIRTPTRKPSPSEEKAKKDDADISITGSYTGVINGDPSWAVDSFLGYMHAIPKHNKIGSFGGYGQIKTKDSKTAEADSFLVYGVYQRSVIDADHWWKNFQPPYLSYRFAGGEFDRKGDQLNFVTSPMLTFPFRLASANAVVPAGVHLPHMTINLGAEFVDVRKSVLAPKVWNTRGLAGATFSTGYEPKKPHFYSLDLTSAYQVRLPHKPEIFLDDRFAPVDATGKKGDTPPMLGTQARHYIDTKVTWMLFEWGGLTFEYTYGSLPPVFERTGHSFQIGPTITLKQSDNGRYAILKPPGS
jgi:hypothetical protein